MVTTLRGEAIEVQVIGGYFGRRYATFINDLKVPGYLTMSGPFAFGMPVSGLYYVSPVPPRQAFATISAGF